MGYSGSPAKKRKVTFESADSSDELLHDNVNVLPTPAKSSQAPDAASQKRSSQAKSKRRKAKQGHIDFSNHIGTKLEKEEEEPNDEDDHPKSTARHSLNKNPFRGTNSIALDVSSDSSSDDEVLHHPSPPRSSRRTRANKQHEDSQEEDGPEQQDSDAEPVRRSSRKKRPRASIVISSDEEDEAAKDGGWDSVLGSDTENTNTNAALLSDIGEPETSGDDVMQSSPMKKANYSNGRGRGKAHQIADIIRGGGFVAGDDEEVEVNSSPGGNRRKDKGREKKSKSTTKSTPTNRQKANEDGYELNNFIVEDDEGLDHESDDDPPVHHARNARQPLASVDSSDEEVQTPIQRRRLSQKGAASDRRKNRQEEEDLAEDLDFLGSTAKSPSRLRSSASTAKYDPRREALEEFKRRRAGDSANLSSSAPKSTQRPRKALYDTSSESEEASGSDVAENEDEDEIQEVEPVPTAREMFEEDEEEDDFIDNDDDPLGVPDAEAQLPLAYSNLRFAKAKDLFKYAIEWMVQKKLNPAFSMTDEVYGLAFRKLNDEAQGLTGSKFMSSAWTPVFARSLKARPQMTTAETGADGMHHCEACNRKSHPATWEIQFAGRPYSTKTLDDLEQDDDDDNDNDSTSSGADEEAQVYDSLGNLLPPTSQIFHLGRTCQQNASTAHALEHWRYNLNEWVVEYLRSKGYLKPKKIVERDAWKTKKRRKFANKVTDEMEESGEIATLYKVFKAEIEAAHEAKGSGYERYDLE